jgi:hypothetical protein
MPTRDRDLSSWGDGRACRSRLLDRIEFARELVPLAPGDIRAYIGAREIPIAGIWRTHMTRFAATNDVHPTGHDIVLTEATKPQRGLRVRAALVALLLGGAAVSTPASAAAGPHIAIAPAPHVMAPAVPHVMAPMPHVMAPAVPHVMAPMPHVMASPVPHVMAPAVPHVMASPVPHVMAPVVPHVRAPAAPAVGALSTPRIRTPAVLNPGGAAVPHIGTTRAPASGSRLRGRRQPPLIASCPDPTGSSRRPLGSCLAPSATP